MKETLRDKIAIEFMKSILSSNERMLDYKDEDDIMSSIAKDAYLMSDKMLSERQKE